MKNKVAVVALILALLALALVSLRPSPLSGNAEAKKETAFERVMRMRTLRCAYAAWPPYFVYDPNTKNMSGINYEVVEAIGKAANLKVEWQEEVGYGNFPDQLRSGKQDMFCSGVRLSVARAQRVEPSKAIAYMPLYAYVRDDDARFDGNISAVNADNVTIAVIDGSTIEAIAKTTFPKAKQHSLPEMSDMAPVFDSLAGKKADVVFTEDANIVDYNKYNPSKKLRRVSNVAPLRTMAAVFPVAKGEWELRDLINAALDELRGDGVIDRILDKYDTSGAILRVTKPYDNSGKP